MHLAIEVTRHGSLTMNRPKGNVAQRTVNQRASYRVFKKWTDDLVRELFLMPETCAQDVADRGGAPMSVIGDLLSVTREDIRQYSKKGMDRMATPLDDFRSLEGRRDNAQHEYVEDVETCDPLDFED